MKLSEIYSEEDLRDEEEALHHYLDDDIVDFDFKVGTIDEDGLKTLLTPIGNMTVVDAMRDYADQDQLILIQGMADNFDEERIIVLDRSRVVDGNHHVAAAHMAGKEVKYIDLETYDPEPDPSP